MNWTQIEKDMNAIRLANESSLTLRRGSSSLSAQSARVEIAGSRGFRVQSDAAREHRQAVVILGAAAMDIALEDRFTLNDLLYRVVFIQPGREACTIAEAVVVE